MQQITSIGFADRWHGRLVTTDRLAVTWQCDHAHRTDEDARVYDLQRVTEWPADVSPPTSDR